MWIARFLKAASGLTLALAAATGCSRGDAPSADARALETVQVTAAAVRIAAIERSVDVVGTLYGEEETTIASKVSGRVIAVLHDVGDRVPAGRPLVKMDPTDFELGVRQRELAVQESLAKLGLTAMPPASFDLDSVPTVQRSRLQADNARSRYERGKLLHDEKPPLLSDQDYADLKTAWEVARSDYDVAVLTARSLLAEARSRGADLAIAQQRLADTVVLAPLDDGGAQDTYAVAQRLVSAGEYVTDGKPLMHLIDDQPIKARAAIAERFLSQVKVGQKARVRVEAEATDHWGAVSRINPRVDAASRTFEVEVLVPNPDRSLRPGAFGRVSVFTHTDEQTTLVPVAAVTSFAGVTRVYVLRDGKAAEHRVTTGPVHGDMVEITPGLPAGAQVITSNQARLFDGTPVTLTPP